MICLHFPLSFSVTWAILILYGMIILVGTNNLPISLTGNPSSPYIWQNLQLRILQRTSSRYGASMPMAMFLELNTLASEKLRIVFQKRFAKCH